MNSYKRELVKEEKERLPEDNSQLLHQINTQVFHKAVSGEINALTEKTALVGNDLILIEDSEASNAKKKAKLSNIPTSLSGTWGYMILQLFPRASEWGNGYLIANAIDEGIQLNFSLGTWIDPNTDMTITVYYNCTSSDSEVACKLYLGAAAVGSEQPSWNIENGTAINLDSTTALNLYKHEITVDNGDIAANDYIHCQVRLNEASRTINFRNAEVKFKYA